MTITHSPPTETQTFTPEPGAKTEQELIYELFRDEHWPDEAYLVFANKFNRPIELSNGKVVVLPMPSLTHQRILGNLYARLTRWLEEHKTGEVLIAPHPVRLWPGKYREPDVMVWLNARRDRMGEQESGPPDMAIEIVSPSNELHDTDTKLREYAQAGITEYWIIYPHLRQITVHRLEGRAYKPAGQFRQGERACSTCLARFELALNDLFPTD